ncbi:MAG: VOC family protein [Euryarchaeota archaeon]|nr:VOC family protein [Euryarchaeota archaeon]
MKQIIETRKTPRSPGDIRYQGVNHLAMATGDMEKTIHFYRDLLGFRLTAAIGEPGYRHYFFSIDGVNGIAFFEWPGVQPLPRKPHGQPVRGPWGFDHVAFGVATEEDLWAVKDRLAAAGFEVSEVIDHGTIHSIYTYDPNHIPLEFSLDVRKNPQRLVVGDPRPTPSVLEGPDPVPGRWPEVTEPTPREKRIVLPGIGSDIRD